MEASQNCQQVTVNESWRGVFSPGHNQWTNSPYFFILLYFSINWNGILLFPYFYHIKIYLMKMQQMLPNFLSQFPFAVWPASCNRNPSISILISGSFEWQPATFVRWVSLYCNLSSTNMKIYINMCRCESLNKSAQIVHTNEKGDGTSLQLGSWTSVFLHG